MTARFIDDTDGIDVGQLDAGDTEITEYTWDHRGRLVRVADYDTFDDFDATVPEPSLVVEYRYDYLNQWIATTVDADGSAAACSPETTHYVHDRDQVVLELDATGAPTHRYLWAPAVDMLLADETISPGTDAIQGTTDDVHETFWTLLDNQNSVRDILVYDDATDQWELGNHITYDTSGNVVSETGAADCFFDWIGRPRDKWTGDLNVRARWYDPVAGEWISLDPSSFAAGDANLYRYCGNDPVNFVDPTGLDTTTSSQAIYGTPKLDSLHKEGKRYSELAILPHCNPNGVEYSRDYRCLSSHIFSKNDTPKQEWSKKYIDVLNSLMTEPSPSCTIHVTALTPEEALLVLPPDMIEKLKDARVIPIGRSPLAELPVYRGDLIPNSGCMGCHLLIDTGKDYVPAAQVEDYLRARRESHVVLAVVSLYWGGVGLMSIRAGLAGSTLGGIGLGLQLSETGALTLAITTYGTCIANGQLVAVGVAEVAGSTLILLSEVHEVEWALQGPRGGKILSGEESSGFDFNPRLPKGQRLSFPDQAWYGHTEGKLIAELWEAGELQAGRFLTIEGRLAPCNHCRAIMEWASKSFKVVIRYIDANGNTWIWDNGVLI